MNFQQEIEQVLFFYGFRQCTENSNINYCKLTDNTYLLFKIFEKHETADLFKVEYIAGNNPCTSKPLKEETIKLSFYPGEHDYILKEIFNIN